MARPDKKDQVHAALKDADKDLTISDVADKADVTRATARKHVNALIKEDKVEETRRVGKIGFYEIKD